MTGWGRRLLDSRHRLSTQLYVGIGGAVLLTVVASLVGWMSFTRVGEVQSRVNDESVPALAAAFGIAQLGGALVAAAPSVVAAGTPEDLDRAMDKIAMDRDGFARRLAALARSGGEDARSRRIGEWGQTLIDNILEVEASVGRRFALTAEREALRDRLDALYRELSGLLVPAIDDQLFYAVTGYRELGAPPVATGEHLSAPVFNRYRLLAELQAEAAISNQTAASALDVSDAALLEPLRERLEASNRGIDRRVAALDPGPLRERLEKSFAEQEALGLGPEGSLATRARELDLEARQAALLAANRAAAGELVAEAESLVEAARESAREATRASSDAILTGQRILIAIGVFSVLGAAAIAWLFVGRVLARRLARLSDRMRRMAEGDLEEAVEVSGRGEIAEMSSALEVFRRHALEVQRLNLVEKLAGELQSKNDQLEESNDRLEQAMGNLEQAQDQIVMREKLAALGELTAGVAHEIRNPLNFVKNFAESSQELMEELVEEVNAAMGEAGEDEDEDARERRELIGEIGGDISGNLDLIRQHGSRADGIVQSMLLMGRGGGEPRPVDLNKLIDEHARLAYHSARATDPSFQLEMVQDLEDGIGEVEAIPQDLGRVFLNMVSNACYATDEKRRALAGARAAGDGNGAPRYEPALAISSRSAGEDEVEVRLRDNGDGIPDHVVDKIFNPFFTTKPTDKGTGLGLALCNDIVRQHGGTIQVETETGAFTEMIVRVPRKSAMLAAALEDGAGGGDRDDADDFDDDDLDGDDLDGARAEEAGARA